MQSENREILYRCKKHLQLLAFLSNNQPKTNQCAINGLPQANFLNTHQFILSNKIDNFLPKKIPFFDCKQKN